MAYNDTLGLMGLLLLGPQVHGQGMLRLSCAEKRGVASVSYGLHLVLATITSKMPKLNTHTPVPNVRRKAHHEPEARQLDR